MLLSMVVLLMRRQLALNLKSGMVSICSLIVVMRHALSPYREESLTPLRRVLPMIRCLWCLPDSAVQHNQQRQVALLATVNVGAFMCRTTALSDWLQQGVQAMLQH
jgi:hypothetical protein